MSWFRFAAIYDQKKRTILENFARVTDELLHCEAANVWGARDTHAMMLVRGCKMHAL